MTIAIVALVLGYMTIASAKDENLKIDYGNVFVLDTPALEEVTVVAVNDEKIGFDA